MEKACFFGKGVLAMCKICDDQARYDDSDPPDYAQRPPVGRWIKSFEVMPAFNDEGYPVEIQFTDGTTEIRRLQSDAIRRLREEAEADAAVIARGLGFVG